MAWYYQEVHYLRRLPPRQDDDPDLWQILLTLLGIVFVGLCSFGLYLLVLDVFFKG